MVMRKPITACVRHGAYRFAALAVLSVCASPCVAVRLDADGVGQVLIYPYYTTRGGNQTIYTVTNHSDRHKLLQVVMNEARNGRDTIRFNVFLAAYDSWSATTFTLAEGSGNGIGANIIAGDASCTYPKFDLQSLPDGRTYVPLFSYDYTGTRRDAGPLTEDRTREGYVQVFELATVIPDTPPAQAMTAGSDGNPANCDALQSAYGSYWAEDRKTYLTNPTGGLSGEAMVLNVASGTVMSYQATALADFRTDPADVPAGSRSTVVNHYKPDEMRVDLDDAVSDPVAGMATASINLPNRRLELQYPLARAIDAVSAVLAADAVNINYVNDPSVDATTDWVVTLPTRPFYTDAAIVGAASIKPFTGLYPGSGGSESSASMLVPYSLRDRSGRRVAPVVNESLDLRFNTQVIAVAPAINQAAVTPRPLGSSVVVRLQPVQTGTRRDGGWMTLDLLRYQEGTTTASRSLRPAEDGTVMLGLPVIGFAALNYVNAAAAPGVLANYSMANPQRRTQDCRRNTVPCK